MNQKQATDIVRRDFLKRVLGVVVVGALTPTALMQAATAADAQVGLKVDDVKPEKLADKIYYIPARQGKFPSVKNKAFFTNIMFIVSSEGVIVIDPSASLQIGQMAIRMIKTVTDKPVVAVINTHWHGDHWMGNHAFEQAYPGVKIYALKEVREAINGALGAEWIQMALDATKNATIGTKIVAPNTDVKAGDVLKFGDVSLKMHHYGKCHTPYDMLVEIEGTPYVHMGDLVMEGRMAGMGNGEGSFIEGIETLKKTKKATPNSIYFPAHGNPGKKLVDEEIELFETIYNAAAKAQKEGKTTSDASAAVKKTPFMKAYAKKTEGFDHGLGQWITVAYQEAESANF